SGAHRHARASSDAFRTALESGWLPGSRACLEYLDVIDAFTAAIERDALRGIRRIGLVVPLGGSIQLLDSLQRVSQLDATGRPQRHADERAPRRGDHELDQRDLVFV